MVVLANYKSLVIVGKLKKNAARLCPLSYKALCLTQLSIGCNDSATLATVISQCSMLFKLHLQHDPRSVRSNTAATFNPVERSLHLIVGTSIRVLCLSYYSHLTNDDFLPLMHADLHAVRLDFCGSKKLTDNGMLALLPSMPKLNSIEIRYCPSLTYEIVLQLPLLCKMLRRFTFINRDWNNGASISKAPELMRRMLCKLYPHVAYWSVLC